MKKAEAIKRISWRFSNFKTFNVNQKDIDAWNEVLDILNSNETDNYNNNILTAKLYMRLLKATLEYYGADIFDNRPQKALHTVLARPLEWHYDHFTNFLNNQELYQRIENGKLTDASNAFESVDIENNIKILVTECLRKYSQS